MLVSKQALRETVTLVSTKSDTITPTIEQKKFNFTHEQNPAYTGFTNRAIQESLSKWGMADNMYMARFHYDQPLKAYDINRFVTEFFNHPSVNAHIKTKSPNDQWGSLGKVEGVKMEETSHSVTSLDFFDCILNSDIVRPNGEIRKCLDEYVDPPGFLVSDELRKCLAQDGSSLFGLFSKEQRDEFLFHVFKAVCLGGRLCQYEDYLEPYLEAAKALYKDLISVRRNAESGDLEVSSRVYKIAGFESVGKSPLFPMEHLQNFCYLSVKGIDKGSRTVEVWYHASDVFYQ